MINFEFIDERLDFIKEKNAWLCTVTAKCPCGSTLDATEYISEKPKYPRELFNKIKKDYFTEEHLLSDGFTLEQIHGTL